ncbi:MAG: tyrosine-type recombinase/integrase [Candidatus Marinimicrobia bacterium]|nr:tyrosine-type recombinase/integrase [Candidatus Neomarinimicrobiota bacterium]
MADSNNTERGIGSQSLATHLIESGTDIRYIQSRILGMGHKSSKTTEIYTRVSKQSIGRIKSQLESLNMRKRGVDKS